MMDLSERKEINCENYYTLISCYGKDLVHQELSKRVREFDLNEENFYDCCVSLWKKYGYYLAITKDEWFYHQVISFFQKSNPSSKKRNENHSLLSFDDEIFYGICLLKRDYISILERDDDFITLDLGKIFSSLSSVELEKRIVFKFLSFYQKNNRDSYFDQKLKKILFAVKKENDLGNLFSLEKLEKEFSICGLNRSSMDADFLMDQIDLYLSYSEARYQFQVKNLGLVDYFISLYFRDWNFEDLRHSGFLGLNRAILNFDIRKGVFFSSYSFYWIKYFVFNSAFFDFNLFNIPYSFISRQNKIMRFCEDYFMTYGKEATDFVVAEKFDIKDMNRVPLFRNRWFTICDSLDHKLEVIDLNHLYNAYGDDSYFCRDKNFEDNLIDLNVNVEEACVFQEYFSQFMNYLNCKLDDKEKEILFKRVGYGYDKPYSLSKIALEYSVSRETIRRWEDRIFKRLNKTREGKCFNPYRK